jgi:chemotaxis protein MotB
LANFVQQGFLAKGVAMLGSRMGAWIVLAGLLGVVGCGSGPSLKDQNAQLTQENQRLHTQLDDREARLKSAADPAQLQAMQNELAAREARIKELESQLRKPEPGTAGEPGLEGIQATYDRKKGELTVNLPADILFASGSSQLKPTSKGTLDKVIAAIKKQYPGKAIRVEGHTDSDPIVRSSNQWIDNLDLSLNRAATVSRYLIEHGLDYHNIATTGWGTAKPKGSKPSSRRVEIIVVVG